MKTPLQIRVLAFSVASLVALPAAVQAATIFSTTFVSDQGFRQELPGAMVGLSTNLPGSSWIVGAGWDYSKPFLGASWDSADLRDAANLGEEHVALGLSLASTGGYVKPTQFTVAGDLMVTGNHNNVAGLGFWSAMPLRLNPSDGTEPLHSYTNFTGLVLNEVTGTLQLFAGGALVGSPISVGSIVEDVAYNLSYSVNTATGALSNIMFAGSPVTGISSNDFTDPATSFTGAMTGGGSRAKLNNFTVNSAVPEPGSFGLLALGSMAALGLRRKRAVVA